VAVRLRAEGARLLLLGPPRLKRAAVRELVDGRQVSVAPDALAGTASELRTVLAGCDSLIHLGYHRPTTEGFWGQLVEELAHNVVETARVLDSAQAADITFVCFASSTAVYGPTGTAIGEDAPLLGRTPYAIAKLIQETCAQQWSRLCGHPAAILRLATVYGPDETAHRAVPNFIAAVLGGRSPVLDGAGSEPFDLIYVGDVAEAFTLATTGRIGGTFNIGTGIPRTARAIAEMVIGLCGANLSVTAHPDRPARAGAICDVSAAAAILGFRAWTPLEAGLREEIDSFRSDADWPAYAKPRLIDVVDLKLDS